MSNSPNDPAVKRYTINDIVRTFGLSRTTIMYYESIGIVTPGREGEQDRRVYSDADVYRLMSAITLKNVGIAPKDMASYLDDQPFTVERCGEYAQIIERDIAYQQAKLERIETYGRLCEDIDTEKIMDVPPYYFCPDSADTGYHRFPAGDTLDLLIAHMPITGLGSRFDGDVLSLDGVHRNLNHWGRTVPVRYAHLIDGFDPDGLDIIGGCTCYVCVRVSGNIRDYATNVFMSEQWRAHVLSYLGERGLRPAGKMFSPFSLPSDRGFVVPSCLPVEKVSN